MPPLAGRQQLGNDGRDDSDDEYARVARIVIPAVLVPLVLIVGLMLGCWLWRRKRARGRFEDDVRGAAGVLRPECVTDFRLRGGSGERPRPDAAGAERGLAAVVVDLGDGAVNGMGKEVGPVFGMGADVEVFEGVVIGKDVEVAGDGG